MDENTEIKRNLWKLTIYGKSQIKTIKAGHYSENISLWESSIIVVLYISKYNFTGNSSPQYVECWKCSFGSQGYITF